jgi:hypothetical protein
VDQLYYFLATHRVLSKREYPTLNPSPKREGLGQPCDENNPSLNPSPKREGLTPHSGFGEKPVPLLLLEKGSGG